MHSELLRIYGPISIQWYGLMIFIGLIVFIYACLQDSRRKKLISAGLLFDCINVGILSAIIGARILFLYTNRGSIKSLYDYIAIWDGGLSSLGGLIGVLVVVPLYMKSKNIKILPLLDIAAVYAPLLQSIARIGCLLAGCCYGCPANVFWAIRCSECGVGIYVHPTQLYSSLMLFSIFMVMKFIGVKICTKPGQLMVLYLILESVERFVVDFWRGDREFVANTGFWSILSLHQFIALGIGVTALCVMIMITVRAQRKNESV